MKHSLEDHETKMGDSDGGADMAVELEAGQRKFLNKFRKILNTFPKLRIKLLC